ncbi:DUF4259 domain-containing protein [Kitasatospora sp. NPDC085464]|uniref:DUF4259 domain-containing protein n=1 Tax=Kitasatospora sp. NPDC085464 TaxID=3364063 RepID=UPI0037C7F198
MGPALLPATSSQPQWSTARPTTPRSAPFRRLLPDRRRRRLLAGESRANHDRVGPFDNDTAADFAGALDEAEPVEREAMVRTSACSPARSSRASLPMSSASPRAGARPPTALGGSP